MQNRSGVFCCTMETTDSAYLDYAAATPIDARVLEAMMPYFSDCFYNPSAPYALSRSVKAELEDARARIAHLIGAKPANITFAAGATEANNLAFAATQGHVIASAIEHESILACVRAREHALLGVSSEGLVDPRELASAITPRTELVSIALANGEIGAVQPMREISQVVIAERKRRLKEGITRPIWLHTDASQAASSRSLNVSSLGVDLMTVSAAKIYGPKQMGLLWSSSDIALRPLVLGGGQENGLRSGTENVPAIMGFASAFELAAAERSSEYRRLKALRNMLQSSLENAFPWAIVAGPGHDDARLCNLVHISFPGLDARRLVIQLDTKGVSVGTGSACAASKMRTSHVLEAIGMTQKAAAGSLRITLGRQTTHAEIDYATRTLEGIVSSECDRLKIHQEGTI